MSNDKTVDRLSRHKPTVLLLHVVLFHGEPTIASISCLFYIIVFTYF